LIFLALYRILAAEYYGKVVAVLPFVPWSFLKRLTMRGLELAHPRSSIADAAVADPAQAGSFALIFFLTTLSVKYIVHEVVGVKPPPGADKGMFGILDNPKNQAMLKKFGFDPDYYKQD
jgi:hypothetical protein